VCCIVLQCHLQVSQCNRALQLCGKLHQLFHILTSAAAAVLPHSVISYQAESRLWGRCERSHAVPMWRAACACSKCSQPVRCCDICCCCCRCTPFCASRSLSRLNASSGRVVSDHTLFPCGVRRNFAGEPRAGAGVGYVVPMSKGKCNMVSVCTVHCLLLLLLLLLLPCIYIA
jgi:hypothetical protein